VVKLREQVKKAQNEPKMFGNLAIDFPWRELSFEAIYQSPTMW